MPHKYTYRIKSFSTVDGDTLDVELDLGFGISRKVRARIAGIDCPETRRLKTRKAGAVSEEATRMWMYKNGLENKVLWSKELVQDKYGRVMADIIDQSGKLLSEYMLTNGYARPYDGGAKEEWEREVLEEIVSRGFSGVYIDNGVLYGDESEWSQRIL